MYIFLLFICHDNLIKDLFLATNRVIPSTNTNLIPIEVERPQTTFTTKSTKISTSSTTTAKTTSKLIFLNPILKSCYLFLSLSLLAPAAIQWLEWSNWSNCSENCGTGIRVRTRLCSNTSIDGSSDLCAPLGGDSFEIESCQNSNCNRRNVLLLLNSSKRLFCFVETNIFVSCTLDLPDERCPLNHLNDWRIEQVSQSDGNRPVTDHTRGGKQKRFPN